MAIKTAVLRQWMQFSEIAFHITNELNPTNFPELFGDDHQLIAATFKQFVIYVRHHIDASECHGYSFCCIAGGQAFKPPLLRTQQPDAMYRIYRVLGFQKNDNVTSITGRRCTNMLKPELADGCIGAYQGRVTLVEEANACRRQVD